MRERDGGEWGSGAGGRGGGGTEKMEGIREEDGIVGGGIGGEGLRCPA